MSLLHAYGEKLAGIRISGFYGSNSSGCWGFGGDALRRQRRVLHPVLSERRCPLRHPLGSTRRGSPTVQTSADATTMAAGRLSR